VRSVAVTGISGYVGTLTLKQLDQEKDVETVVGIDVKPPTYSTRKLKFYSRDVREPLADIFAQNEVDTALHLAFVVPPTTHVDARAINIGGSQNFLRACETMSVEALFYLSSHTVYGAHRDNPTLITEDQPLRPVRDFPYAEDKAEVEPMFHEYAKVHPKQCVTVVRAVPVIGPGAATSGLDVLFMPVAMYVLGYDPGWQFIYGPDLARLVVTLLRERRAGVFNAGADGSVSYRDMLRATGKPSLGLPSWVWSPLIRFSWALRIQKKSPVGGLEFMKYPILVSAESLTRTIGCKLTYDSREAFKAFMDAKIAGATDPRRQS
jgi:UDP-glucose 4-epimerase